MTDDDWLAIADIAAEQSMALTLESAMIRAAQDEDMPPEIRMRLLPLFGHLGRRAAAMLWADGITMTKTEARP